MLQRHGVSKCCWKDVAIRLAPYKVATDLQCVKQRAIQGGGLVYVGSIYSPTLGETVLDQVKSFFFFFFKLEDNCFTIFCWFLPYINTNQS